MRKIKTQKNQKKFYIIVGSIIAVFCLTLSIYYFQFADRRNAPPVGNTPNTSTDNSDINLSPPTSEESHAGDKKKDEIVGNKTNTIQSGIKTVTPEIVSYKQTSTDLKVSGRVPGVIEDGGTCTLTLTLNAKTVTQTKTAVVNVSETSCGFIAVPLNKLNKGIWSATVNYDSPKAKGTSSAEDVEVK